MHKGDNDRGPRARIARNPFYVLGLPVDCSRAEVEREGQKLLGMLALDLSAARTYRTPLGELARTAEAVREAMAELRDPERRLMHEMWARLPLQPAHAPDSAHAPESADCADSADSAASAAADSAAPGAAPRAAPWHEAMAVLGWQSRRGSGP